MPDRRMIALAELRRLQAVKTMEPRATGSRSFGARGAVSLGEEMIGFYKQSVAKRQTKLAKIAECWIRIVPPALCDHCALESLSRGSLVVVVDSSSHLYELKQLLLSGLQEQLLAACKSTGLRKISLKIGRWYEQGQERGEKKLRFSRD